MIEAPVLAERYLLFPTACVTDRSWSSELMMEERGVGSEWTSSLGGYLDLPPLLIHLHKLLSKTLILTQLKNAA